MIVVKAVKVFHQVNLKTVALNLAAVGAIGNHGVNVLIHVVKIFENVLEIIFAKIKKDHLKAKVL